jgi:hypothetical protein
MNLDDERGEIKDVMLRCAQHDIFDAAAIRHPDASLRSA